MANVAPEASTELVCRYTRAVTAARAIESPSQDSALAAKIARYSRLARTSRKVAGRSAARSGWDTWWSSIGYDGGVEAGTSGPVPHRLFIGAYSDERTTSAAGPERTDDSPPTGPGAIPNPTVA